jgi:hypothetical protein
MAVTTALGTYQPILGGVHVASMMLPGGAGKDPPPPHPPLASSMRYEHELPLSHSAACGCGDLSQKARHNHVTGSQGWRGPGRIA